MWEIITLFILVVAVAVIIFRKLDREDRGDGYGTRLEIENAGEVKAAFGDSEERYPAEITEYIETKKRLEKKFGKDMEVTLSGYTFKVRYVSTGEDGLCERCRIVKAERVSGEVVYEE